MGLSRYFSFPRVLAQYVIVFVGETNFKLIRRFECVDGWTFFLDKKTQSQTIGGDDLWGIIAPFPYQML